MFCIIVWCVTTYKWSNSSGHLEILPPEVKDNGSMEKFAPEFKKDVVALVTEQGYSIAKEQYDLPSAIAGFALRAGNRSRSKRLD